ncbi:unnamed protein product [Penicillium salamii]|uniref:Zn(2)-C6 fungal-type domain-containing protein n=1 Tax=Penicillium salamii TaxID=1612424 RepID=A0A9W4NBW7_9EURO|nr:unnamed protein product [Penicillium salamii]CAG8011959.1 unnamed protein product [Penicillium salamii]CAG8019196.1 unnamed protein product [Penicillium salamii]CAG8061611.1 unnamed protein product [Penicillium salamii]CAG8331389.1 unnamed protein product [Penicillium salamii]
MTGKNTSETGNKRKRGENRRASLACETCRKQKEKCEGGPPCWRCQRLGRPCHFQGQPLLRAATPLDSAPSSAPTACLSGDKKRTESLEYIAHHFLGNVSLDEESLAQIVTRLQSSAAHSARMEGALDINESFDVQLVSRDIAHYSGEFSHWNFSQKLRRKMSGQIGQLDAQVKEYWRPTQLQSSPQTLVESMRQLPPKAIAEFLIDVFFKYVEINSFYMERSWIEEKMEICYDSNTIYRSIDFPWVCSVFAVLAIGIQVAHMEDEVPKSNTDTTDELRLCSEDSVGLVFYHVACKLVPDVLLVASHESVQAFLLLATYSLPVSTGGLAYTYYGLAMKMAIQNGMHRQYPGGDCDWKTIETRNRLFWTVYSVEKYISIMHGRPISIAKSEINADMPTNSPAFTSPGFSNMMAFHTLISYLGEISDTLAQFKKCPKRLISEYSDRLLQLRARIKQWWDTLPATEECRDLCSQGPLFRQNSHLKLCYLLIYVYMGRPFIFVEDKAEGGVDAMPIADLDTCQSRRSALVDDCVASALDILNTLQSLSDHVGLCRASYNEFGACRAALLVILAESLNSGKSQRLQDGLQRGMSLIRQMIGGSSTQSETSYIEAIEAAISQYLAAPEHDSVNHSNTSQSPISAYTRFQDWTKTLKKDTSTAESRDLASFSPLSHLTPGTERLANPQLNDITDFFNPEWSNEDLELDTNILSLLSG